MFKLLRHVVFVQGRPILFSFHRKEAVENARYGDLNSDIPVCLSTDTPQNVTCLHRQNGYRSNKVVSLARDIEKQAATVSDDQTHSASLVILGSVLENSGHRQEALHQLGRSKQMGISSEVYFWIAIVH